MTALAVFAVALATGTYWGICYGEKSREIDAHIARFFGGED